MSNRIFIITLPRSGSTLLQRLLSGHPDIATVTEPWFLLPLVYTMKEGGVYAEYSAQSVTTAVQDLITKLPRKQEDYYAAIRLFADSLYDKLNSDQAKYFLDKTPRYYLIIDELFAIYPDAKFIFLLRNPLAVYASIIKSFNRGRLGVRRHRIDAFRGPVLLAAGYEKYRSQSLPVHFEDLATRPSEELQKIYAYLGVEFKDTSLDLDNHHLQGKMGDQHGTRQYKTVEQTTVDKWKQTFGTRYRKSHALKYLGFLGPQVFETLGYNFCHLESEIRGIEGSWRGFVLDSLDYNLNYLATLCEWPLVRRKLIREFKLKSEGGVNTLFS